MAMNRTFQEVAKFYKPEPVLSHRSQVLRMYRKSLRLIMSWSEDRDIFNDKADEIRAEFTANKHHPADGGITQRLMREGRERLAQQHHPDPYIVNYMPGGTLFMRNSPLPMEALYPEGIPAHVSKRRVNIDFSNIPDDQPYADKVFVDSVNKTYWIDK
eukprot:gene24813-31195_t